MEISAVFFEKLQLIEQIITKYSIRGEEEKYDEDEESERLRSYGTIFFVKNESGFTLRWGKLAYDDGECYTFLMFNFPDHPLAISSYGLFFYPEKWFIDNDEVAFGEGNFQAEEDFASAVPEFRTDDSSSIIPEARILEIMEYIIRYFVAQS